MRKRSKLLLGGLVSFLGILCVCGRTYASGAANPSAVSASKDNVIFEKTADWVKYNGSYTDEMGNPYAQIDISAKALPTEPENSVVEEEESIDVVLVLDCSTSMKEYNKLEKSKIEAEKFVNNFFDGSKDNRRVGIVLFSDEVFQCCDLSSNKDDVIDIIRAAETRPSTNIQVGIWIGEKMLEESSADNKYMVLLSDGMPTVGLYKTKFDSSCITYYGEEKFYQMRDELYQQEKIIYDETYLYTRPDSFDEIIDATIEQSKKTKDRIKGLKIITIGFDTTESQDNILSDIASEDEEGNRKLFYKGDVEVGEYISLDMTYQKIINIIDENKGYEVSNVKITDQLPNGIDLVNYEIIEGNNPKGDLVKEEEGIISQEWENNGNMETYHIRLIVSVNTDIMDKEYWNLTSFINTNGKSMDIFVDSTDSAVLEYKYEYTGKWDKIGLLSPMLDVDDILVEKDGCEEQIPEPTPTPILEIIPKPITNVSLTPEFEPTPEITLEPSIEPTPEITLEPSKEPTPEATLEPSIEPTSEVQLKKPIDDKSEEIIDIDDEKIPLNSDLDNTKKILPIIEDDEIDDTPKTGYPEDLELEDYKNQYLIIRKYGVSEKKYVLKNIWIAIGIVGILFSAGLAWTRSRKE